jgi:ketol-acid reductoisomerase
MTAKMYYDADADPKALDGQKIVIVGYGSQGHAHAQNLHDSGYDVTVVEANPKARAIAEEHGLKTADIADAVKAADVIMILVPDTIQKKVYETSIEPNMHKGQLLMFAHGFNIRFDRIKPSEGIDVGMVAPKGPGHLVRSVFEQGGGVPALFAVEKDATGTARARTLAYARGIGATRAGVLETTFKEETETDLFGEQAVLCGGVTNLIRNGFETLVAAGYQPELAYFEVMHEMKLIVDLMYRGGMNFMRFSVSDTAEYGDYVSGPRVIGPQVRESMQQVLKEIQDGTFAANWIAENEAGSPEFKRMREAGREHQIEKVGASLRKAMPFLNPVEIVEGQPQAAAE